MRHETKWTSSIILLREEKFLRHGYLEETVELDPRGVEQEIERFDRERERSAGNGGPRTIVRSFLFVRGKISAQCHGLLFRDRFFIAISQEWQIIRLYWKAFVKSCSPCKNSCKKFYVAHDYNVGREECEQKVARLID